ncbi:MAG: type IV pilus secretin PilQ [Bdellovibrio sp. CG10_big_fil_rev_8_21_14_0_10_47_8]|nr:MAG: type IV pilus secretin PilQ [Bdellovibrio sp. CG10_big_fil_rev_8_21_14_0_10_47_8]
MKGFLRLMLVLSMSMAMVHCASTSSNDSADSAEQGYESSDQTADTETGDGTEAATSDETLDNELNAAEGAPDAGFSDQAVGEGVGGGDEFSEFEADQPEVAPPADVAVEPAPPMQEELQEEPVAVEPPPPEIQEAPAPVQAETLLPEETPAPPPIQAEAPPVEEAPSAQAVRIKNMKYKANDNGGTLVVEANGPMNYETRMNEENNQFIIEIPEAILPAKLKRPFNTRDMKGGIGSVDAYQNKGSTTARIVVQLREGAAAPVVQVEGNSLLIVEGGEAPAVETVAETEPEVEQVETPMEANPNILSSLSLEEFLSGNTKFYGKKINLETSDMDIREAIKFISDESGVNLVLADGVKGSVSLKLRQVPWDQALVVIMRAKGLGYTRAGSVLRIAPIADIKAEEDESVKMAQAKKALIPLRVRMIPISYAKVDEIVAQIKPFLSTPRGTVIGDTRTSAVVISDLDENIERVMKLIKSIDVPPPQVLIEGKVVEASDTFQRQLGINWSSSGQAFDMGNGVRGSSSFAVTPGSFGAKSFNMNFNMGTLDVLGDLNAQLALYETQSAAKVLSSPRVVTMHNETAEISQSTEVPIVTETANSGALTRSVTYKAVKLKLLVTPQITNDGAVIMAVDVSRDFLGGVADLKSGAQSVNSRAAKTKVMVKNGQTAVIGGIYQSDQTKGEDRVPWIADVPILGWLFKNQKTTSAKNELLIFLTPRILGQLDSHSIRSEGGDIQ